MSQYSLFHCALLSGPHVLHLILHVVPIHRSNNNPSPALWWLSNSLLLCRPASSKLQHCLQFISFFPCFKFCYLIFYSGQFLIPNHSLASEIITHCFDKFFYFSWLCVDIKGSSAIWWLSCSNYDGMSERPFDSIERLEKEPISCRFGWIVLFDSNLSSTRIQSFING